MGTPSVDTAAAGTGAADVREIYRRASTAFGAQVHRIGDNWQARTPCSDWDVRALVQHVIEEELWTPPLFAGETVQSVGDRFAGDLLGTDPVGAFDQACVAAAVAVQEPGAIQRTVHLSFGDVPGHEYTMQLAADHLVHAWDLARALGADVELDQEAVAAVRTWSAGMEDPYRAAGVIGPRPPVRDGAGPQAELLAMFGRTP